MKSYLKTFFHFPLTKIIVGLFVCIAASNVGGMLSRKILSSTDIDSDLQNLVSAIFVAAIALIVYFLMFKFYEKREIAELSKKNIVRDLAIGIVLGAVLQSLTIFVIYLFGGYEIVAINPVWFLIPPLTLALTSAIVEEILLRGIIFRISEEKLGSYIALLISAALFGALHLGNPNSSVTAGIGLATQAGLLLGAAYIYSRNLWFPIAVHFAWNFSQSAIYGAAVPGKNISNTLITSNIEGAQWYTGGSFGPEGAIQATLFCSIATVVLLMLSHKKGHFVSPYWKHKAEPGTE